MYIYSCNTLPWRHFLEHLMGVNHVNSCSSCRGSDWCPLRQGRSHRGSGELCSGATARFLRRVCSLRDTVASLRDVSSRRWERAEEGAMDAVVLGWQAGRGEDHGRGATLLEPGTIPHSSYCLSPWANPAHQRWSLSNNAKVSWPLRLAPPSPS